MPITKLCAAKACGHPAIDGRHCAIHREASAARRHVRHALNGYHTTHWQHIRRQRLALDNHLCQMQLPGCTTIATTVDLDASLHGNHRLATLHNTRSACKHCNSSDGAKRGGRP